MSASGEQQRRRMSDIGPGSADAQRRKISAWLHVIGVNLGLLLAGIVAVELIFGEWFAPYHPPPVRSSAGPSNWNSIIIGRTRSLLSSRSLRAPGFERAHWRH